MLEPVHKSAESHRQRPVCSVMAICCPALLLAFQFFLKTQQGHHLYEQLFERYYTAGMMLGLGFYLVIGLSLALLGLTLGVIAFIRRETPSWLPYLAVAVNALAPLAVLGYLRGG